jgi:hypothetical protein
MKVIHDPLFVISLLIMVCCLPVTVRAQTDELTLYVRRNFGYGGGSQIQGNFHLEVEGPSHLSSVTFKIDETVVATITQPPFAVDFNTNDYGLGWHALVAVGQTSDGQTLTSNTRRFEFVSAEAGWQAAGQMVGPMLALIGGLVAVGAAFALIPTFMGKRQALPLGGARAYGLMGGAICPKCQRPFSIHWWSLNVSFAGKFDRCDYCGQWSMVRRSSPEQLRAAEAAELAQAQPSAPLAANAADGLKQQLDESRFLD